MKASTQYNDFVGTAAADGSDHITLGEFLQSRGVDTTRYKPIGDSFFAGYEDFFMASILCVDTEGSASVEPHMVQLSFEQELTKDEFFSLFKRMNVVFTLGSTDYPEHYAQADYEEVVIDDNEAENEN